MSNVRKGMIFALLLTAMMPAHGEDIRIEIDSEGWTLIGDLTTPEAEPVTAFALLQLAPTSKSVKEISVKFVAAPSFWGGYRTTIWVFVARRLLKLPFALSPFYPLGGPGSQPTQGRSPPVNLFWSEGL